MHNVTGSLTRATILGSYIYYLSPYDPHLALDELERVYDELQRVKLSSVWTIADFKRMKADLLIATNALDEKKELIETLLVESVEYSTNDEFYPCAIKCLTSMVTFCKLIGDKSKLEVYKTRLQVMYDKRSSYHTQRLPAFMRRARSILDVNECT